MVQVSHPNFALQGFQPPSQGPGLVESISNAFKTARDKRDIRTDTEALITGQDSGGEKLTPLQRSKSFARLTNLGGADNAKAVMGLISGRDKVAKEKLAETTKVGRRNSLVLANAKTGAEQKRILKEQIETVKANGGDPSRLLEIMQMSDYEDRKVAVDSDVMKYEDIDDLQQTFDVQKIADDPSLTDEERFLKLEKAKPGLGVSHQKNQKAIADKKEAIRKAKSDQIVRVSTAMLNSDDRLGLAQKLASDPNMSNEQRQAWGAFTQLTPEKQDILLKDRIALEQSVTAGDGDFTKGVTSYEKVKGKDGEPDKTYAVTPVLDKHGGVIRMDRQPIQGELVSMIYGETPAEYRARMVGTAGGIQRETDKAKIESIEELTTKQTLSDEQAKNLVKRVEDGTKTLDTLVTVDKSLELLGQIKTGGIDNVILRFQELFGIEDADKGLLASNLGKAILSQLRNTFGAQFTEREGARLSRIEAGFGKSTERNIALLQQLRTMIIAEGERALRGAYKTNDTFMQSEILRLLPNETKYDEMGNAISEAKKTAKGGKEYKRTKPMSSGDTVKSGRFTIRMK